MPTLTIAEEILKELKMLNANLQNLNATMAKPRLTLAEYEEEEFRQFLAEVFFENPDPREQLGDAS